MVAKDETRNTWYVRIKIKDTFGGKREIWKRGFKTKHEAVEWETEQKKVRKGSTEMTFGSFCNEIFLPYMKLRVKHSSFITYEAIVKRELVPYFGNFQLEEITAAQITKWENEQRGVTGVKYKRPKSLRYLKDVFKMLSMVFKHAIRFYGLARNPAAIAGNYQGTEPRKVGYWTLDEFRKFYKVVEEKEPKYALPFALLYWLGLREGELYVLTAKDFDFTNNTVSISKTGYKSLGVEYTTAPKTAHSNRTISVPKFLSDQLQSYLDTNKPLRDDVPIFHIGSTTIRRAFHRLSEEAGVKKIRLHDLRRSHCSLLVDQGFSLTAIAKRLGHNSTTVTALYADLFPHVQGDIAASLDAAYKEVDTAEDAE